MHAVASPLDDLRAKIDRIDQDIVHLLIERTEVVRRIGEVKDDVRQQRTALRPAREARILRRLIDDAAGRFPAAVLVRMWRELLAAQTRLQTPLTIAVYAPRSGIGTWDLARDHFGALTPTVRVDGASQAIRAVGDGSATVAVLPLPGDDDGWWPALISDRHDRLRVFARLPFVAPPTREPDEVQALAIARLELEPSGDDLSLLAIEAAGEISRARLRDLLVGAGLRPAWLAVWRSPVERQTLHLVEVAGFVVDGDQRIGPALAAARGEILRIVPIGGYARPVRPDEVP